MHQSQCTSYRFGGGWGSRRGFWNLTQKVIVFFPPGLIKLCFSNIMPYFVWQFWAFWGAQKWPKWPKFSWKCPPQVFSGSCSPKRLDLCWSQLDLFKGHPTWRIWSIFGILGTPNFGLGATKQPKYNRKQLLEGFWASDCPKWLDQYGSNLDQDGYVVGHPNRPIWNKFGIWGIPHFGAEVPQKAQVAFFMRENSFQERFSRKSDNILSTVDVCRRDWAILCPLMHSLGLPNKQWKTKCRLCKSTEHKSNDWQAARPMKH